MQHRDNCPCFKVVSAHPQIVAINNVSLCDGFQVSGAPEAVPSELHKHELGSGRILEIENLLLLYHVGFCLQNKMGTMILLFY